MQWDSTGEPGEIAAWDDDSPNDRLEDEPWDLLKGKLAPDENVVWTERACPPPAPTLAVFPAFFAAVLCGLSGYALMVLFGIYGIHEVGKVERVVLTCLPPAVLGFVIL